MNEKIRELAIEAHKYSHRRAFGDDITEGDRRDIFEEKFAELIVKECLDFLEVGRVNGLYIGEVSSGIKEHFGVEE